MNHFYSKAVALLALGFSALSANAFITKEKSDYVPEDRSAWTISGCSQCNASAGPNADGGFAHVIDDNINTFWHSNWSGVSDQATYGHYFVIDRGANAPEIKFFGYTPRQHDGGNGFVTKYRLFAVDENPGLPLCEESWSTADNDNTHAKAVEWSADRTPLVSGDFDIVYNDVSTHGEHIVEFPSATSARYLVFFMDAASNVSAGCFANCAEFKTYTDCVTSSYEIPEPSDLVGKQVMFKNCMHDFYMGVGRFNALNSYESTEDIFNCLANVGEGIGAVWTVIPGSAEGKYKLFNEYNKYYVGTLPTVVNRRTQLVAEEAEAGEWTIRLQGDNLVFEFEGADPSCMHMVNWNGIVCWYADAAASQFTATILTDEHFSRWAANAVDSAREVCNGRIGYPSMSDGVTAAIEALGANPADFDAYHALNAAVAEAPVVLPAAGKYYTIRGAHESFRNHFITEAYDRQIEVSVGSGDAVVTGNYNEVIVAAKAENIIPQLWAFNLIPEGETHAGNYILTTPNSGSALRCPNWGTALAALPLDHSDVGHYTILEGDNRQFGGVTLVSPNSADKGTVNIDGEGPSFNSWNGTSNGNNWFIELVETVSLSFNAAGYAAAQFPFAVALPEGVKAYTVASADENCANLVALDLEVLPANTPAIFAGEPGANVAFAILETEALDAAAPSVLLGTNLPLVAEKAFVLEGAYLVPAAEGVVPANGVYLLSDTENDGLDLNIVVTGISISATETTLEIGETATLVATVEPADATDATVTWSSSDEAVATVSAEGVVTAVAEGTATITAACGDFKAECVVTVLAHAPIVAETVTLDKTELELKAGESATLVATVLPEDAEDKTIVWSSSDEAVAAVSAEGVVTAVAEGTATITAACGGVKAECVVTVTADIEDLLDEIRANAPGVELYDLSGRRVLNPAKGVYILLRNGAAVKVTL